MRSNDTLLFIIAVFLFIIILILLPPWAMNIFLIVLFVLFFIGLFFLLLILMNSDYGILPLISFALMFFLFASLIAFFSDHFSSEKTPIENAISYFLFLSSTFGD